MTLTAAADGTHTGKFVKFSVGPNSTSGKTKSWILSPASGARRLGVISWFAPWRRYCFYPESGTVFEWDCLRDIADFIQARTAEHYA